ncbi:hypothetical protein QTN25_002392 [Entamoeba marina]
MLFLLLLTVSLAYDYCHADYPAISPPPFPLSYVQVITRHGDRAAMKEWDGEWPFYCHYKNNTSVIVKKCHPSELTYVGVQQQFYLGQRIMQYFKSNQFLSKYSNDNVSVRSTNTQRTIHSAINFFKRIAL